MLQSFRDGMGRYGKWLMVLIAIPFALFGVETFFFRGASVEEAASVNGDRITQLEVRQAIQRQRAQIMARFADIDPAVIDDKALYGPALQSVVTTRVYESRARKEGMGVAPALVAEVLKESGAFHEDGKFSRNQYLAYIGQLGYTPQTHSRFLARELLASQLARGILSTGFMVQSALDRTIGDIEQTRDFRYLNVPLDKAGTSTTIDEAAARAYYDGHPDLYVAPEHVVVNYIELSVDQIAGDIAIDESELKSRYTQRVEAAEAARQTIVSQILVKPKADGSHLNILRELQAALTAGADFAELARAKSEDALTADQGGEIGPYDPEKLPAQLRAALDKVKLGQVTPPIETDMGWHLLKLVREDEPTVGSFEAERDAIAAELRREKAGALYQSQIEHLREAAYTAESLATVATSMGLPLNTSSVITRDGGEGIGSDPKVVSAAFSEDVLKGGYISPLVEPDGERAIVLELKEHTAQQRRAFAEVKTDIDKVLIAERKLARARERAEAIRERLLAGESLEKIARDESLEWQMNSAVKRYDADASSAVARRVFDIPQKSPLPFVGIIDHANDIVVFQVVAIHAGDIEALPKPRRQQMERAMWEAVAGDELNAYQGALLASAKIDTRPQPQAEQPR
ncbi:MAG: SurA N-terminal domain-containing protein [Porticoccaceae bacterium]